MTEEGTSDSMDYTYPELIVLDLDYTLWPFWVDTHVDPPFTRKGNMTTSPGFKHRSRILDSNGKIVSCFAEVPQVLEYIHSLDIPMAVASRTGEVKGAKQLIKLFGWSKYFKHTEIYPGSKVKHFSRFKKATGIPYESMMFFDDEERNISDLTKVRVYCVFVRNGVTMKLLKDSLKDFAENPKSREMIKKELRK